MSKNFMKAFIQLATREELNAMAVGKQARQTGRSKGVPWHMRLYASWWLLGYSVG